MPLVGCTRHQRSCCIIHVSRVSSDLPALERGDEEEKGAVESNDCSKKDDHVSVTTVADRDYPVDQRQHRELRQGRRQVKHQLGGQAASGQRSAATELATELAPELPRTWSYLSCRLGVMKLRGRSQTCRPQSKSTWATKEIMAKAVVGIYRLSVCLQALDVKCPRPLT